MTFEDDRNWEKLFAVSIVFEKVLNARNSFDNAGWQFDSVRFLPHIDTFLFEYSMRWIFAAWISCLFLQQWSTIMATRLPNCS